MAEKELSQYGDIGGINSSTKLVVLENGVNAQAPESVLSSYVDGRIQESGLAEEVENLVAGQSSSAIYATDWSSGGLIELSTRVPEFEGQGAFVPDSDTGSHLDPVSGVSVSNAGSYTAVNLSGTLIWKWLRADTLAEKADKSALAEAYTEIPATVGISKTIEYKLFDGLVLECIADDAGGLRIVSQTGGGTSPVYYGDISSAIQAAIAADAASSIGIARTIDLDLKGYPALIEAIFDDAGGLRIISATDSANGFRSYGADGVRSNFILPTQYVVFLVVNQSNEDGRGDSSLSPVLEDGLGYMWRGGTGATLLKLQDPTNSTTNTGSAWPAFARQFYDMTGMGVVIVTAAVGGTPQTAGAVTTSGSTQHWDAGGQLRQVARERANNAVSALDASGIMWRWGGILGGGGEADAQGIDSGLIAVDAYKTAAIGMLDYFRTQFSVPKLPFIMSRVARDARGDTTGFQQIRAAQMELCQSQDGFVMAWTAGLAAINAGQVKADGTYLHLLQPALNDKGRCMGVAAAYRILAIG